jgi:hypothetical protein
MHILAVVFERNASQNDSPDKETNNAAPYRHRKSSDGDRLESTRRCAVHAMTTPVMITAEAAVAPVAP